MTLKQIQQLHTAVHRAWIEGKAKTWGSVTLSRENKPTKLVVDISEPKEGEEEALAEVLRQHGLRILPLPGVVYAEWKAAQ